MYIWRIFCRTGSNSSNQIFNADRPKERPQGNIFLTTTILIYLPSMMYHQKSQQKSGPCITSRMLSVTTKCSVPCTYLDCASIPCIFASCKHNMRQSLGKWWQILLHIQVAYTTRNNSTAKSDVRLLNALCTWLVAIGVDDTGAVGDAGGTLDEQS